MADTDEKVGPSGLTLRQAEELHANLVEGTRIFFCFAVFAHLLAYIYSPWLH